MSKLTILLTNGDWEIHRAGCADIERKRRAHEIASEEAFDGLATDAIEHILDDEIREMGYDENSVRVFPCAKESAPAPLLRCETTNGAHALKVARSLAWAGRSVTVSVAPAHGTDEKTFLYWVTIHGEKTPVDLTNYPEA